MSAEKYKIAMLGHKRIPSREGGVEIVVEELSKRMARDGHEVHAFNRSGSHVAGKEFDAAKKKEHCGICLHSIPTVENGKLNAVIYSFLASLKALFGKYDIIHYHAEGPCAMLWIPRLFKKHIIATIHGLDWQRGKWGGFASWYLKTGEKIAVKYADEIIVLSERHQRYFLETYNRKTVFIPNGVTRPTLPERTDQLQKWDLENRKYILFLARIVPEKGLHYLLEAYKQIDNQMKLVIAGSGSHTDSYLESIKEAACDDERIVMTGFVSGDELEQLYANAYLYVLTSDVEGMSLSLLEAMSYGNCCLVSDIPENMEVVGDACLSFRCGDICDLAAKISWALANPDEISRYRSIAAEHVLSRYRWDEITDRTVALYRTAISKRKGGNTANENSDGQ